MSFSGCCSTIPKSRRSGSILLLPQYSRIYWGEPVGHAVGGPGRGFCFSDLYSLELLWYCCIIWSATIYRKRGDTEVFGIRRLLRQVLERLAKLEEAAASSEEKNAQSTKQLAQRVSELSGAANRHDMAIEDMLESWEELQEQAQSERNTLASALTESAQRERQESLAREKALLSLVMSAHDRLFELQRAAEEAGAELWLRQLVLAQQKLEEARLPAGFQAAKDWMNFEIICCMIRD